MRNKIEILNALESIFLSIQNKINNVKPGSVIHSIFYSLASVLEDAYERLEEVKNNSYVHTATGEYLDQLVYGLSKLERIPGRRAFGYVALSPVNVVFDSVENIESLNNIVFSNYNLTNNTLYMPPLKTSFFVSTVSGVNEYVLLPPLKYLVKYQDNFYYEINPNTGKQRIAEIFTNQIKSYLLQNPDKLVKYIILPAISVEYGTDKNLLSSSINVILQAGNFKISLENNFDFLFDATREIIVDIDSVAKVDNGVLILGESSEFRGGAFEETDEELRNRYWSYLNSLSKGTLSAIQNKLLEVLKNAKIQTYTSNVPGVIDIYLYSDTLPISSSLLLLATESLEEVKPAGVIVNLRIPRVNYINVIVDTSDSITKNDVENIKLSLFNKIKQLNIGEGFSYSKLWDFLNSQNIKFHNPYFGFFLDKELFELYKNNVKDFVCLNYYKNDDEPDILPDFCESENSSFTYYDYLNLIREGNIAVFLYEKTGRKSFITNFSYSQSGLSIQAPRYPLKAIVKKVLNGEKIGDSQDQQNINPINEAINTVCRNVSVELCLKEVVRNGILNSQSNPQRIAITIKHIEKLDENYANYLRIKMMTLPISSSNDIELCESKINDYDYCLTSAYEFKIFYTLLNDVQYIEYKDLEEIQKDTEIIRVFSSNELNKKYTTKYNIGVRSE